MSEQSSLSHFGSGDSSQTDQYECGICGRSFDSTVGRGAYMPQTHDESEIRTELLAELQNLADELGRTPHQLDMDQQGGYGTKPYRAAFGSLTKTLDKIGLEHQTIRYPDHLGHKVRSTYEEEIADTDDDVGRSEIIRLALRVGLREATPEDVETVRKALRDYATRRL
jgi:hypothetical protein